MCWVLHFVAKPSSLQDGARNFEKMGKYILGTKIGMTQIFDGEGNVIPVTLIQATPNVVVQAKTSSAEIGLRQEC